MRKCEELRLLVALKASTASSRVCWRQGGGATGAWQLRKTEGKLQEDLRRMEGALEGLIRLCGASGGKVRCPMTAALMDDAVGCGLFQVHCHERRFVGWLSAARRGLRISR